VHFREMAVSLDAQRRIGDVAGGNERRQPRFRPGLHKLGFVRRDKIEPDLHLEPRPSFFALQLRDRLFEELAIKIEPYRHDMTALRRAEDAAGAANLEVAHRDAEPRA